MTGDKRTRRGVLAALASTGVLAAAASTTSGQSSPAVLSVGGGPVADSQAQHLVKVYSGTLAERPGPGVNNRLWVDESDGSVYEDTGSAWELVERSYSKVNNVHKVTSEQDLYDLFPDVTDGTWSSTSKLSDGDKVFIDGRNAPYRVEQDLRIESVTDVVIQGSAPIDIKPADGVNAGKFVLTGNDGTPSRITFRDVGYDGNAQEMTGGDTPFIVNWVSNYLKIENCFATNNYPYHVHNGGGSAIIFKDGADYGRVVGSTFDDVGDRSVEFHNNVGARIVDCHADNGFDRMVTFDACSQSYAAGNTATDHIEGSFMGVNGSAGPADSVFFVNNHIIGEFRNLVTIEPSSNPVTNVRAFFNSATNPNDSALPRNLIHEDSGTEDAVSGGHVYVGNYANGLTESGFEFRHGNDSRRYVTRAAYNTVEDTDAYGFEVLSSAADVIVEDNNLVVNATSGTFNDSGARTRMFGIAHGSNNAENPGASFFSPGDYVNWTDTGDGSGDGLYLLNRAGNGWYQVSADTF